MALRLTRQQRINNVAGQIVEGFTQVATQYRKLITEGLDVKNEPGLPDMKATGAEVFEALHENGQIVKNVIAYILDGKSNKIVPTNRSHRKS